MINLENFTQSLRLQNNAPSPLLAANVAPPSPSYLNHLNNFLPEDQVTSPFRDLGYGYSSMLRPSMILRQQQQQQSQKSTPSNHQRYSAMYGSSMYPSVGATASHYRSDSCGPEFRVGSSLYRNS